jgi:hypothetical protein
VTYRVDEKLCVYVQSSEYIRAPACGICVAEVSSSKETNNFRKQRRFAIQHAFEKWLFKVIHNSRDSLLSLHGETMKAVGYSVTSEMKQKTRLWDEIAAGGRVCAMS